jgi:serine/threonine protein kinase
LQKEVQAVSTLCGPGTHVNIVQILNHGQLSNDTYYFIDMELCDLSLHDYIHQKPVSGELESIPYFIRGAGSTSSLQIWIVMSQIAAGVEYIHGKGHIHRDIKPSNGTVSLLYN